MFSYLQNISSASEPRKAEAADSRLGNKDKNSANDPKNQSKNDLDISDDAEKLGQSNRFSIKALIYFLEDALEEKLSALPEEEFSVCARWFSTKHGNSNTPMRSPLNSVSSRQRKLKNKMSPYYAAHEYAHCAKANSIKAVSLTQLEYTSSQDSEQSPLIDSSEQENAYHEHMKQDLSELYALICNLQGFRKTGITHLDISQGISIIKGARLALKSYRDQTSMIVNENGINVLKPASETS